MYQNEKLEVREAKNAYFPSPQGTIKSCIYEKRDHLMEKFKRQIQHTIVEQSLKEWKSKAEEMNK